MRQDLQTAWDSARKTDGTIYRNPGPEDIEPFLETSEKVLVILKCLKKWGNLGGGEVCTAVLTDKTVHIFSRGILKSVNSTHETIPFSTITGVELARKLSFGWIIGMTRAANVDSLLKCDEEGAKKFASELKSLIANSRTTSSQIIVQNNAPDPLDQLKKLKELLDAGVLTHEEFEVKKEMLLSQI